MLGCGRSFPPGITSAKKAQNSLPSRRLPFDMGLDGVKCSSTAVGRDWQGVGVCGSVCAGTQVESTWPEKVSLRR